jgi:hypothetical protein
MRVYKFLSAKDALRDISERRIKISEIGDMNDPFELLTIETSTLMDRTAAIETFARRFGALCFSRSWKSPLLWAHYADKHRGICLGLDIADDYVSEISYVNKPSQLQQDNDLNLEAARRWVFSKIDAWRYEDEIRVYTTLDERDGPFCFYGFGDALQLREIIAGCRFPSAERPTIDAALRGYSVVPTVLKTRLSMNSFDIIRDPDGFLDLTTAPKNEHCRDTSTRAVSLDDDSSQASEQTARGT